MEFMLYWDLSCCVLYLVFYFNVKFGFRNVKFICYYAAFLVRTPLKKINNIHSLVQHRHNKQDAPFSRETTANTITVAPVPDPIKGPGFPSEHFTEGIKYIEKLFLSVNFFLMGSGGRARDERDKCHRASVPFRLCLFTKHMLMKCVAGPGRERDGC